MKDTYYFSHDSNALSDPKILALRCDFGMEGYGFFWAIVEMLSNQDGYRLHNSEITFKAIKMMCQPSFDVADFIEKCVNEYRLFCLDGDYFYSPSLSRRMEKRDSIKQKRQKAIQKRWEHADGGSAADIRETADAHGEIQTEYNTNTNVLQKGARVIQNDTKESKGKEIKENKKILAQNADAFFEKMWALYPNKKGKGQVSGAKKMALYRLGEGVFKKCIIRYLEYIKKTNREPQFILHGSTFFNSGYVDYLDGNYSLPDDATGFGGQTAAELQKEQTRQELEARVKRISEMRESDEGSNDPTT